MNTQDLILTIANIIISLSLVPQVISGFRTKSGPVGYSTSIPYSLCLGAIAAVYASLGLWFSMIVTGFSTALWALLALQRTLYHK